jgi:hypothetical protein
MFNFRRKFHGKFIGKSKIRWFEKTGLFKLNFHPGLRGLALIVEFNKNYASEHQVTIIESLEHSDEIIKRGVSSFY